MILLFRFSGTSPSTIFWAMPSEIAVLPTPGSPTRIGLFLVLLLNICRTLRISSSLPITGSSLPCAALSLRLTAKRLRFSNLFSAIFSILHQLKSLLGVTKPIMKPIDTPIAVCSKEQTAISQIIFQTPQTDKMSDGDRLNYSAGTSAAGSATGNSGAGAAVSIFSV